MNKSRGSKPIRAQNILHKHANRSRKHVQGIVERHNTLWFHVRKKSIQIALRPFKTMIAINPQNPDGPLPRPRHVHRARQMRFHLIRNSSGANVPQKIPIRRIFWMVFRFQKNVRIVRIDRHNGAVPVMRRNLRQHDRGASLEAANLHNRAFTRHACSEQPQEARFVLRKVPRHPLRFFPRIVQYRLKVSRNVDSSQSSSP